MQPHYTFSPELTDRHKMRIARQIDDLMEREQLKCNCGRLEIVITAHEPIESDCEARIICACRKVSRPSFLIDLTTN